MEVVYKMAINDVSRSFEAPGEISNLNENENKVERGIKSKYKSFLIV